MDEVPLKTYRRRWWILIIYSLLAAVQNIYWLTYNTTAILTQEFYQTSEIAVTMISMIGPICYFVFALLSAWVLDYLALRKSIVIASAMMMFCSFLRIAAYNPQTFWIIFVAQVFNASAAPLINNAPAALSAEWFPPSERTTATAIGWLSQTLGSALAFLFGFLVNKPADIWPVVILQAIIGLPVFIPIFIYFPDGPPTSASLSSDNKKRLYSDPKQSINDETPLLPTGESKSFVEHFRFFLHHARQPFFSLGFMICMIAGGVSQGVFNGWISLLDNIIQPLGFSDYQVSWLGFSCNLAALFGGIIVAKANDLLQRRLKLIILLLYGVATVCFIWFTLCALKVIPGPYWMVLLSASLASAALNASCPILFEISVEITYPTPEAVTGALLTMVMNLGTIAFMVADIFTISVTVINWLFCGTTVASFVFFIFMPVKYRRSDVDEHKQD